MSNKRYYDTCKLKCGSEVSISIPEDALHVRVSNMFAYINGKPGSFTHLYVVIWRANAEVLYEMLGKALGKKV